ncbi:hypothetical protein K227x_32550 [Rubripirellula lacrimiformis]|uniref:Uncharacterized protein n=1 Tax=Rubripirellula lacrimiformis TaxID=1930273 RepID=A0A517NCT2_9BACT|nr:hypothetical protein [Rubripirellula lacrimiformis]QDT04858.1 hypothetical protein K227x_32550 [Rubripirellula lacrimiformis]
MDSSTSVPADGRRYPNEMTNATIDHSERLAIRHLFWITLGVALAFCVSRGLVLLRFPVDAHYRNLSSVEPIDPVGILIAGAYGCAISLFSIAARSKQFWASPGKTLSLIIACMCLIDWILTLVATLVVRARLSVELAPGVSDLRGELFGIWYDVLVEEVGFVLCLPILTFVIYKTRRQRIAWRVAYNGFLVFAICAATWNHFDLSPYIPRFVLYHWYPICMAIPAFAILIAICVDCVNQHSVDWWTLYGAASVFSVWIALVALSF